MPVGHEDHGGVPVAITVAPGRFHEALDLGLGEVFASPQVLVRRPSRGNCSIYGGWRDQLEVAFRHVVRSVRGIDCSYNAHCSHCQSTEPLAIDRGLELLLTSSMVANPNDAVPHVYPRKSRVGRARRIRQCSLLGFRSQSPSDI